MDLGWIGLIFVLQILIRIDFLSGSFRTWLIRVKLVVSRVGGYTSIFYFCLLSWALHLDHVKLFFLSNTLLICIFFYFGLYLDYMKFYLDFN